MHNMMAAVAICMVAFAMSAAAQVTGSGTAGTVAVFTGSGTSSTVGSTSTPITVTSTGNVGIGTTAPASALDVAGSIALTGTSGSGYPGGTSGALTIGGTGSPWSVIQAQYGTLTINQGGWANVVIPSGNVGIGTPSPNNPLNVFTAGGSSPVGAMSIDVQTFSTAANADTSYFFRVRDIDGNSTPFQIQGNGSVGIGTTNPGATLEVNGTAKIDGTFTVGNGGIYFPGSSTPQMQPYTGVTCGDYAESVDVAGDRKNYEPGDLLVIGAESGSDVLKSAEPYSTLVAGIYSTKPGTVGRRQTTDYKASKTEVPMAMVGIVPAKVSAENGPIKRGDLLVTSSTLGYAMKGTDRSRMLGAVVGKALGSLDSGTGVIEVLVTLQ